MSTPSSVLGTPYPVTSIPSAAEDLLGLSSWISPSWYLRKGIEYVIGCDPVEKLAGEVGGDWEALAISASALHEIGGYAKALGRDIAHVRTDLVREGWTGEAADAALGWLDTMADSVKGLQAPLDEASEVFRQTATSVKEFCGAIADSMDLLFDYLIELGIGLCATTGLAWTGIGGAIAGAGTAYIAYKATSLWMKIVDLIGSVISVCRGTVGLMGGALSTLNMDEVPDLRGGPR